MLIPRKKIEKGRGKGERRSWREDKESYQLREFSDGLGELMVRTATTMHALSSCVRACVRACLRAINNSTTCTRPRQPIWKNQGVYQTSPPLYLTHHTTLTYIHVGFPLHHPAAPRSTTQHHAAPRSTQHHATSCSTTQQQLELTPPRRLLINNLAR